MDLAAGNFSEQGVPVHVKSRSLPDRVTIEVVDRLHVLIEIHIRSEGHIRIVSRLEVSHTAGGYPKTPQHWKRR